MAEETSGYQNPIFVIMQRQSQAARQIESNMINNQMMNNQNRGIAEETSGYQNPIFKNMQSQTQTDRQIESNMMNNPMMNQNIGRGQIFSNVDMQYQQMQ